jgi:hypothetical protein
MSAIYSVSGDTFLVEMWSIRTLGTSRTLEVHAN